MLASGFWRLFSGQTVSQGILLLTAPLFTRLYTPNDWGEFVIFTATVSVLAIFATGRYELAIPIAPSRASAASIALCSSLLALGFAAITGLLGFAVLFIFPDLLGVRTMRWELLPLGIVLAGWAQISYDGCIRRKQFARCSLSRILQAGTTVTVQIVAFSLGSLGLQIAFLTGLIAQIVVLSAGVKADLFTGVSMHTLLASLHRYRAFARYSTWSLLIQTIGLYLPAYAFSELFGSEVAGYYALSLRALQLPIHMVGTSIGQAFLAENAKQNANLADNTATLFSYLLNVSVPFAIGMMFWGEPLFAFVFGEQWTASGQMAQWMGVWLATVLIGLPISEVLVILEKQVISLYFNILLLFARLMCIVAGILLDDFILIVALLSITSALCWSVLTVWSVRIAGNSWRSFLPHKESLFWWSLTLLLSLIGWRMEGIAQLVVGGLLGALMGVYLYRLRLRYPGII
jgi:O-antigen/teichoic acid export membrane protein